MADATLQCLRRMVPAAVPGITFLSGGQSSELASSRLNALNLRPGTPWPLTFSFACALQHPALELWAGKEANKVAAQKVLMHRARCHWAASRGEYSAAMETR